MKREALAVLSSGALVPHKEFANPTYLDLGGVDLSRANDGDVPLLSAHDPAQPIGYVRDAWRADGVLKATLRFDSTVEGRAAFERLQTGEVRGVSVGSFMQPGNITVVDADGHEHDFIEPDWRQYWQPRDSILHVKRWTLVEVSMVEQPADRLAIARPINHEAQRIRRRMEARQSSIRVDTDPILRRVLDPGMVFSTSDGGIV
jgi:phage head maturation protease